jgi:predicted phosphate transport protein (TIGR00153 family)
MAILQPREDRFYNLFVKAAGNVRGAAELLSAMLQDFTDVPAKARAIKALEHAGDELTHEAYEMLNKTFVTPFDREDIGGIASALDDILDLIEAAADDFVLLNVEQPLPESLEMARVILQSCDQVLAVADGARRLRREHQAIRERLTEINRLENEGDDVYRRAIQGLFRQSDPILIIKWKQIFDHLERAIDSCEDFADVFHGVLLKYA